MAREFVIIADRTSPVATWLRALAAEAHGECGGPGVGAIGLCFTGGFALAMAVEPAVLAPVVSQPGLPAPITSRRRAAVGLDDADLARVKRRAQDGMGVLGLRFTADKGCPGALFRHCAVSSASASRASRSTPRPATRTASPARAHAVLTVDLADEPGHPRRAALDRVMTFIAERLLAGD
ncbi:MAG TPA: hypothetical protein VHJ39_06905 [Solirubrobacteraceae bacterium]|nr:hypothetical protein [Solirubrobacteraceae bacterium]